jgi:xanthine/uracil permease
VGVGVGALTPAWAVITSIPDCVLGGMTSFLFVNVVV